MDKKKVYLYSALGIILLLLIGTGAYYFGKTSGGQITIEPTSTPSPIISISETPTPSISTTPSFSPTPTKKPLSPTPTRTPTLAPPTPTSTPTEFKVISVSAGTEAPTDFTGVCPHKFTFNASITVNRAGDVTYKWERSDGASASEKTIGFTGAGTENVSTTWQLGGSGTNYSGWQRVKIISPNDMTSNQAVFSLHCNP